jgi:hypothetical protein
VSQPVDASARHRATAFGGLSVPTAGAILIVGSAAAATVDAYLGNGIGWPFTITFVGLCLYAAFRIRATDRFWAAILAPIAYAAAMLVVSLIGPDAGGGLLERAAGITFLLADEAPTLILGLVAAIVVAFTRRDRIRRK